MRCARLVNSCVVEIFPPRETLANKFHPSLIAELVDIPDDVELDWHLVEGEWLEELPQPAPTADDVRMEAQRRMMLLLGARDPEHLAVKISNGSREAIRLLRIRADRSWTTEEATRAAELDQLNAAIDAIREASNTLEADPPQDYRADTHWPAA